MMDFGIGLMTSDLMTYHPGSAYRSVGQLFVAEIRIVYASAQRDNGPSSRELARAACLLLQRLQPDAGGA